MNASYKVVATKWSEGWELDIVGEGVTQVRTLDKAVDQVRDYLATLHEADFDTAHIELVPDLDGFEGEVSAARDYSAEAAATQKKAAAWIREVAFTLRERGLSVTDMAVVLDVSRGRVSQLLGTTTTSSKAAATVRTERKGVKTMAKGDIDTYFDDGQWKNKVEGGERASSTHETKAEAQKAGREMARDRKVEHVIKNKDGRISEKNSYGNDPRSSKG